MAKDSTSADEADQEEAWQSMVSEQLRRKYPDADYAFKDLQGMQKYRDKFRAIEGHTKRLNLSDENKNRELFQAYIEGLWHFQNPHLGPGHKLGVTDPSIMVYLMQDERFRLYVAGLVRNAPDRMLPQAMLEGLKPLLADLDVECSEANVLALFKKYDSSLPLHRDGTLFIDDFARFFYSGKDAAEEALQETASMSRKKDLEAFSGHPQITYNQSKLAIHSTKAKKNLDLRAQKAACSRRSERMTQTLLHRLQEELGYYSVTADRPINPGHGGDYERRDVELKISVVLKPKGHPGTVNLPDLDLKVQVRLEPGAGPALAMCVLDPDHTGLLTVEQVRIGLRQCGVNLTATETQILVPGYSVETPLGRRVRWVQMIHSLGGLPPSVLKEQLAKGGGSLDEASVMEALSEELKYWEAAARTAVENVEQRFSEREDLASYLFFSPAGIRNINRNSVKLRWALDNESLTDKPRVHAELVSDPPVHMFFTTVPKPHGTDVKVSLKPSEPEPLPESDCPPHPIFDAPLLEVLSTRLLTRWELLRGVANTYAKTNVSGDPGVLNKPGLKYVLLGSLKGGKSDKFTDTQIDTLMAAYPGGNQFADTSSKVVVGCSSLALWDFMLAVSPSLADMAAEKVKVGASIKQSLEDERDAFATLCAISALVFQDYSALRTALEEATDPLVGGVPVSEFGKCVTDSTGCPVEEDDLKWAQRFVFGSGDNCIDSHRLMDLVASSLVKKIEAFFPERSLIM